MVLSPGVSVPLQPPTDPSADATIGQARPGTRQGTRGRSSGCMGTGCVRHRLVQIGAVLCPSAPLQPGKLPSLRCGSGAWNGQQGTAGKPVTLTALGPEFSEPSPCHSGAGVCRGAAVALAPAPMALGACRECSLQPRARGLFMLCVPVRFEMSYWTSLGNFNILKRKIKKKEKEKNPPTFTQSGPRIPGALYGCTRCAPVAAAPLSLTSISPLVLPPALSSLCRDFRLRPALEPPRYPQRVRAGSSGPRGKRGGDAAPVRPCGGSAGTPRTPPASAAPARQRRGAMPAGGKGTGRGGQGKSCCGPTLGRGWQRRGRDPTGPGAGPGGAATQGRGRAQVPRGGRSAWKRPLAGPAAFPSAAASCLAPSRARSGRSWCPRWLSRTRGGAPAGRGCAGPGGAGPPRGAGRKALLAVWRHVRAAGPGW